MVDHRSDVLRAICPRVLVMERGRVVQEGGWSEVVAAPATALVERLLASA
jgi:ABC-type methionine transport system ATPase subunit